MAKIGRNDPCPCGSGRKHKTCCGREGAASPDDPVTLARRFLANGRYDAAIGPLTAAVNAAPGNASLLADLGGACILAGQPAAAVPWLQRSLALRPASAGTLYNLGLALERSGDRHGGLVAFERTVALMPGFAPAQARIDELARSRSEGIALSEIGSFDEAAARFERAIEEDPLDAIAHHGLLTSRRLTDADRPLVERSRSLLCRADLDDAARMTLHFAAGKGLEDLGDNAEAMRHFDDANTIRKRLARPFDPATLAKSVDDLVARFGAGSFGPFHGESGDERPVFVLGMPRSGTTLVERFLARHPAVAAGGELPFWNERGPRCLDARLAEDAGAIAALRRDYLALLAAIGPAALRVTDKMPFNFLWVGLIHRAFPRARIVHCRRDPLDTCLSLYTTLFAQSWGFASDRASLVAYYREYVRLVAHWRDVLPETSWFDIDYEEATVSPGDVARKLVAFVGLDWDEACLAPEKGTAVVRTASKWQARQPIYRTSVARWRRFEPALGELSELAHLVRGA